MNREDGRVQAREKDNPSLFQVLARCLGHTPQA